MMCLTVIEVLQLVQTGATSLFMRCCWVKWMCPILRRMMVNFCLLDVFFRESQDHVVLFYHVEFGWLFSPFVSTHPSRVSLLNTLSMSEYVKDGITRPLFADRASLAALSACSLPSILQWPGIPTCKICIFIARSYGFHWFWMLVRLESESLSIIIWLASTLFIEYSMALRIANVSAVLIRNLLDISALCLGASVDDSHADTVFHDRSVKASVNIWVSRGINDEISYFYSKLVILIII